MTLLNKITFVLAFLCLGAIMFKHKVKWNHDIIFADKGKERLDEIDLKFFFGFIVFLSLSFVQLFFTYLL